MQELKQKKRKKFFYPYHPYSLKASFLIRPTYSTTSHKDSLEDQTQGKLTL